MEGKLRDFVKFMILMNAWLRKILALQLMEEILILFISLIIKPLKGMQN